MKCKVMGLPFNVTTDNRLGNSGENLMKFLQLLNFLPNQLL
jgi:hypothetical protein